MDLMVNPVITDFRQDVNGDIKMLKLGANKEDAWQNIAEQGASAKLDNNKTATINVSTYTEPVVINPTSGKDGMKKATVTLSNIPSGSATLYCWSAEDGDYGEMFVYSSSATVETSDALIVADGESGSPSEINTSVYTVNTVTESGITVKEGGTVITGHDSDPLVFTRYATGDIVLS